MTTHDRLVRVATLPKRPARPETAHKGSFGRVLIVAGSRGMSGAACLAGLGALRGGAGLVFVASPAGVVPIVAAAEPSYLTLPLPEDKQGRAAASAKRILAAELPRFTSLAVGPGLGQSPGTRSLVEWLYSDAASPAVFDADALNGLASARLPSVARGKGKKPAAGRILTPHPGEFARLTRTSLQEVIDNREELAVRFARSAGVVLLLKGHQTIVTDGERLAVNTTGNSGLATGGTGDVLTGLIAALLAQGLPAFEAAQLGAHLHGLAGDLAAAELSEPGLIASDLPRYVARAWLALEE